MTTLPRAQRRRGMSLVEILVTIMVTTILIAMAAGLIHVLLRMDRSGRDRLAGRESVARLARQFRADARAALLAQASPDAAKAGPGPGAVPGLTFRLPGGRVVEYRAIGDELARVETEGETVRRRDRFQLPRASSVQFAVEGDRPALVSLSLQDRGRAPRGAALKTLRIEGVLGRDHRFDASDREGDK